MNKIDSVGSESVGERLLASSKFFARSAAAAYSAESWDVFYLHLATAVEQLVKSVLAQSNPSFIASKEGGFDSLLHLCGRGDRARTPEFVVAVRTISASESFDRVGRLLESYREPGQGVRLLIDTRNGIVHAGIRAKGQSEAILGDAARYVDQLLSALSERPQDYWGDATDMVADHAKRRLSEMEATYARKLQAAKDYFVQVVSTMAETDKGIYLVALTPAHPQDPFDLAPAACPACGHPGVVRGFPEAEWEPDWDVADGEAYVSGAYVNRIHLQSDSFRCPVCRLTLARQDLGFAGIDDVTLTETDYDVAEATAFFERQLRQDDWSDY